MATDPQFIQALSHGLEVLRCFTEAQPTLTNSALARMTGMPRSSISRLTHTLVKLGFLEYDSQGGTYRLGLCVLSMQPAALAGARVTEDIAPHMRELANELGARVLLTVYESYGLTVVQSACTNPHIQAPSFVGCRYGIPRRAMGRVHVASCGGNEQERILSHLARDDERHADALRVEFESAMESYRHRGYCTSLGEGRPGNHSISVTINLARLGRRLFLACGGPADRFSEKVLHERAAPMLLRSAREIERACAVG